MLSTLALLLVVVLPGGIALADTAPSTWLPKLPAAKGDKCVEPVEIMRRQHMDFLLHQRDRTVHEGIRTKKYRFVNCIGCHVLPDAKGSYARHTDAAHFCTSCHRFSAVKIDCFQCHADRPPAAFAVDKVR